jgi:thiol-disulfide isomerase/thioredoxin
MRYRFSCAVILALLLLSSSGSAQAPGHQPTGTLPESEIKGLYPIGDYVLEVDGTKAPTARFYLAEHIPAVLIEAAEMPSLVLLVPGSSEVRSVPPANLSKTTESLVDLSLDSIKDQGKLQILASWIVFAVDARKMVLKERPWLLAHTDIASLKKHSPEYVWRADAYTPDPKVIEELKNQTQDVNVRVFFGSWCAHCKRHVPLMTKVDEALDGSRIQIDYYGLPRGWGNHPVAGPLKIRAVPTAVIFIDGKEVGRIKAEQWASPEEAIKEILEKPSQAPQI